MNVIMLWIICQIFVPKHLTQYNCTILFELNRYNNGRIRTDWMPGLATMELPNCNGIVKSGITLSRVFSAVEETADWQKKKGGMPQAYTE
jgi:hypothetical protein